MGIGVLGFATLSKANDRKRKGMFLVFPEGLAYLRIFSTAPTPLCGRRIRHRVRRIRHYVYGAYARRVVGWRGIGVLGFATYTKANDRKRKGVLYLF